VSKHRISTTPAAAPRSLALIALTLCLGALSFASTASAAPLPTETRMECNTENPAGANEFNGLCLLEVTSPGSTATITGVASMISDSDVTFIPSGTDGFTLNRWADGKSTLVFGFEATTEGLHTLTASYPGDANHEPSQGSLDVIVKPERHPVTLSLGCGPLKAGVKTTCSVVARDISATPTAPTGTIEFHIIGFRTPPVLTQSRCRLLPFNGFQSLCAVGLTPAEAPDVGGITISYGGDATHRIVTRDIRLVVSE